MSRIDLEVDINQLQQIVNDLSANEAQIRKALNSTLSKMADWLKSKSVKGLAAELQIQQNIIRRRIKRFNIVRNSAGSEIRVFYGLNPISLIYLNPQKRGKGVKAHGGRFVSGGFIAPAPRSSSSKQVFKRKGSARLPIQKQVADIKDQSDVYIEDELLGTQEFDAQFLKYFEHELKWQTRIQR